MKNILIWSSLITWFLHVFYYKDFYAKALMKKSISRHAKMAASYAEGPAAVIAMKGVADTLIEDLNSVWKELFCENFRKLCILPFQFTMVQLRQSFS